MVDLLFFLFWYCRIVIDSHNWKSFIYGARDETIFLQQSESRAIDKQYEEEQKKTFPLGKRFLLDYPKIH